MISQRKKAVSKIRLMMLWGLVFILNGLVAVFGALISDPLWWQVAINALFAALAVVYIIVEAGAAVEAILTHREECAKEASRRSYTTS